MSSRTLFRVLETHITDHALGLSPQFPLLIFLDRHQSGDWGMVSNNIRHQNEHAVRSGGEAVSQFQIGNYKLVITSHVLSGFAQSRITIDFM
jgi:hypothetical protein